MADNVAITAGTGTDIAADDISSVWYQRVKIALGADGSYDSDVSSSSPMPVGATDIEVTITPTLSTSGAHTAGDTLFDATEVANAVLSSGGHCILQSVKVIDVDDEGAEMDLYFFDRSVTFGTINSAPGISDADAAYFEGVLTIDTFEDLGGAKVASVDGIGLGMKANATSLYCAAVTQGTPTYAASSDLKIKLYFMRAN